MKRKMAAALGVLILGIKQKLYPPAGLVGIRELC